MKPLKTLRPVSKKNLRRLNSFKQVSVKKSVSSIMISCAFVTFMLLCLGLCFILADISCYKKVITERSIFFSHLSPFIFILSSLFYVSWIISYRYEYKEKRIKELEDMYNEAIKGNVFKVRKEIELNNKKYIAPVQRNSGVSIEIELALNKAKAELKKMKKFYNFLEWISFRRKKEKIYKRG